MAQDSRPPAGAGTEVIGDDLDDAWSAPPEALPIDLPTGTDRYEVDRVLARGSMGVIKVARDRTLKRLVALKTLDPEGAVPDATGRFLAEARITAQLQHPSIVAVYEIGQDQAERPYFAMQLIEGRTLREIIDGLRASNPQIVQRHGRVRLLNLFMQVCMAVAYAHARGVIHRDLKPANIMLGEFGEVFVMDWGLAKVVRADVPSPIDGSRDEARFSTRVGHITGTPAYMSPEQAMGLVDALSEATDIYALGAILHELLTLHPPVTGPSTEAILRLVRQGAIAPPSAAWPEAEVPADLEAVIMRCLARDPVARFRSATELRDEVEACLAGGHTRLGQVRTAARTLREAHRAGQLFRERARQRRRLARRIAEQAAERLPGDPPDLIEAVWADRRRLTALVAELERTFDKALALFGQVVGEAPDNREAHEGLRDLAWYRFLEAERLQDRQAMAVFRALAKRHDPNNGLREALIGEGALTLLTVPAGATVAVHRFGPDPRGDALDVGAARDGGRTPVVLDPLPMGSYLLRLTHAGGETRLPVLITRQETAELTVRLPGPGAVPPGLIHVPAGPWFSGATQGANGAAPRARQPLEDFLIAQVPVTCGDYGAFLGALSEAGDHARVRALVPASGWLQAQDGRWHPAGSLDNPVTGVSARDAEAYCGWRRTVDGHPWRLPQAPEWEKAGRGADGRAYPWGNGWEPTRCRCAESPSGGGVSPVGEAQDQSPYGVLDLAGGVREWTATAHPRSPRRREVRGGGYLSAAADCHLAARRWLREDARVEDVGFRLALDYPSARGGR
ncbi:MAG: SUMF1/EgtB/PvdO family nonheme iron enzyme [Myxococcales bacterium]|nr:SUMF1/EgtB/PvdO family nonheme iron enzyme [Myxococcales bacterium]